MPIRVLWAMGGELCAIRAGERRARLVRCRTGTPACPRAWTGRRACPTTASPHRHHNLIPLSVLRPRRDRVPADLQRPLALHLLSVDAPGDLRGGGAEAEGLELAAEGRIDQVRGAVGRVGDEALGGVDRSRDDV